MALSKLFSKALDLASGYVRVVPSRREIEITERLVRTAAERSCARTGLEQLDLSILETVRVEARTSDGHVISAEIVPQSLEITGGVARLSARVPGGIRVGHQSSWRNLLVAALAGLTGAAEERLNAIDGVSIEGEQLRYERPVGAFRLAAALASGGQDLRVPLSVRPGAIVVHAEGLPLPSAPEIIARLMA